MKTAAVNFVTLCCVALAFLVPVRAEEFCPDLIVMNANVITVDHRNSRAEAFAIRIGRLLPAGTGHSIQIGPVVVGVSLGIPLPQKGELRK